MSTVSYYLHTLPGVAMIVAIMVVLLAGLWVLLDALTPFNDTAEILENRNWGYALQRMAILAAQTFAMVPSISRFDVDELGGSVVRMLAHGLWVVVALLVARPLIDAVVLPRVDNVQAMREGNVGVGLVEAGFFVAVGLLVNGSLTDQVSVGWQFWASTVVFFVAGLVVLLLVFVAHNRLLPADVRMGLAEAKLAGAIETLGLLVALGLVIRVGVAGDFTGWAAGFSAFVMVSVISVVLLFAARWVIDLVLLRGTTLPVILRENQTVAATVLAGALILVGFVVSTTVNLQL